MGKTTFSGPIQTGKNTGAPSTTTLGIVTVTQVASFSAAITSAHTVAVLPTPCRITNMYLDVDTAFATTVSAAADHNLKVGIIGDTTRFVDVGISGVARYDLTTGVSGNAITKWRIPASANSGVGSIPILAFISSVVTALDTGNGEIIIEYRQE